MFKDQLGNEINIGDKFVRAVVTGFSKRPQLRVCTLKNASKLGKLVASYTTTEYDWRTSTYIKINRTVWFEDIPERAYKI